LAETPQAEIWANAPMQLLISNNQGQRIGYDNGVLVNEIPEASYHVNIGGLGIATEPIYSIPLDSNYTITANKEVAIQAHGARRTSQEEANSIVQFGPGYANSVENIAADDQITMSTDGTNIEYLARETGKPSLTFAYRSNQFSLQDINVGAGQVITGAVDTDKSQLIYSNAQNDSGTYDLEINRVDATGVYTFTHPAISVSAGDTHYLDYGAWDGSDTMTLNIDEGSDGSIDQTVILRQADEQVYIPLVVR
jgi:hypothetical protein